MQCNRYSADASPAPRFISIRTSTAMHRSFALMLLLLLTTCLLCSTAATAEENLRTLPALTINPTFGPPTTNVLVSGTGFDPYAAVDIYFDTTDVAMAVTNGAGAFGGGFIRVGIPVKVPVSALPGTHWITARERARAKAAQKPFLVRTDWAQFRFEPDHKGINPYENVLSPQTVGSLSLNWSYQTGSYVSSSPAVVNGMMYFNSDDGNFYALNATTGLLLWTYPTRDQLGTSAAVVNGVVYVTAGDTAIYALNASTGALLWESGTPGASASSPTVANGMVYVASDGQLWALNASTGALLWTQGIGGPADISSPAVANGTVYVGSTGR